MHNLQGKTLAGGKIDPVELFQAAVAITFHNLVLMRERQVSIPRTDAFPGGILESHTNRAFSLEGIFHNEMSDRRLFAISCDFQCFRS